MIKMLKCFLGFHQWEFLEGGNFSVYCLDCGKLK